MYQPCHPSKAYFKKPVRDDFESFQRNYLRRACLRA